MERTNNGSSEYRENVAHPMPPAERFHGILSPNEAPPETSVEAPPFFRDLNLDQTVQSLTAAYRDYDVAPLFHAGPLALDVIAYRQEIMQDLEARPLRAAVARFSGRMLAMQAHLPREKQFYYRFQKERAFLHAVTLYGDAVAELARDLAQSDLRSRGMRALRQYVAEYVMSPSFSTTVAQAARVEADLSKVRYCLLIKGDRVTVRRCEADDDFGAEIEATFDKFRHGGAKDHRANLPPPGGMNHIEAQIVERVALLFPEPFRALDAFYAEHAAYADAKLTAFDREVQFYLAYLAHLDKLRAAGLPFCYPHLSAQSKDIACRDTFDIALAEKLIADGTAVVRNDFALRGAERIMVVSGPNHGGKTTFARLVGQLHYLASLGCAVPGREARLFLFDRLFSHFERGENVANLRGKLQDDLVRVRNMLNRATSNSLFILNEIFASTTLKDAVYLSEKIMTKISDLDALGVWVTFVDELASFNEKTVSMVSTVSPEDPVVRTFKVERRPANGLAYALAIAEKYRVTYVAIRWRLGI